MSTYLITYDLDTTDYGDRSEDHTSIREVVKGYKTWAKITESCYAVKTEESAKEVRNNIKALLKEGDRLFVLKSAGVAAWHNVICRNEWLKEHI